MSRLLFTVCFLALALPAGRAAAADPVPGDPCTAGENAVNAFQWNPTGDNGTTPAAGKTNAIFCIGNVRKSIMTLEAGTGNVGIGTTAPTQLLELIKDQDAITAITLKNNNDSATATTRIMLGAGNNSGNGLTAILQTNPLSYTTDAYTGGAGGVGLWTSTSATNGISIAARSTTGAIRLYTGGNSERMRVDSSGNVGIGTTAPSSILSFGGNAARTVSMERHSTSNTAGNNLTLSAGGATSLATDKNGGDLVLSSGVATGTGSSNITFQTHPAGSTGTTDTTATTAMTILGNGNVGIGTTSPNGFLDLRGSLHVDQNSTGTLTNNQGAWFLWVDGAGNGYTNIINHRGLGTGGIVFSETNDGSTINDLVKIASSGNVGIGTTGPNTLLDVNGAASLRLGTDLTTTGSQNNVAISAHSSLRYAGAGTATFTGLAGGQNGRVLYLHNASASTLTLANQSTSSTAANRIITGTGANLSVPTDTSVTLQYDSTASRWRVTGSSNSGATLAAGSTGQIQFNSGTNLGADSNLFWDNTNKRLGIGTASPAAPFDLQSTGSIVPFIVGNTLTRAVSCLNESRGIPESSFV